MTASNVSRELTPQEGLHLLHAVLADDSRQAYAILVRQPGAPGIPQGEQPTERASESDAQRVAELLVGDVVDVEKLADIPLRAADGTAQQVLSLVPFRQVRERGYAAHDDGAPLRCLVVRQRAVLALADVVAALPAQMPHVRGQGFDVSDDEYVRAVQAVISDEIGRGEGANFVIRRDYVAQAAASARALVPAVLRRLLTSEQGAYWTFGVVTDGVNLVGATPERHVSVSGGVATMNPISGTFRKPAGGVRPDEFAQFLMDTKEVEELFMVVDEELKMMSEVCSDGGTISGPFLKEMSRVIHTEYLLTGRTRLDVRDVLRETMFAPTVTGSPMQNACAVIERHEANGRGYYSGVAALMTPNEADGHDLDAPILIRTAQVSDAGQIRVGAGATLVRHSTPLGEVAETAGKAAGVLGALGLASAFSAGFGAGSTVPARVDSGSEAPADGSPDTGPSATPLSEDRAIQAALHARNAMLSPFWLSEQAPQTIPGLAGRSAVVVDVEDRFTTMLAHVLRHLGMDVTVLGWRETAPDGTLPAAVAGADLVVCGPGPGDPENREDPRIGRLHAVVAQRRSAGLPLLAVCLSHQVVALQLGVPVVRLAKPRQGTQLTIDLFGHPAKIGFYNTFTARLTDGVTLPDGVEVSADPTTGDVFAFRGPGFATIQGHAESVLSVDGVAALASLARHALGVGAAVSVP